jgi:hypothetical protein
VLLLFRQWTVTEVSKDHHAFCLDLQSFEMQVNVQQSKECNIPENFKIQQQLFNKPNFRIAIVLKLLRTHRIIGLCNWHSNRNRKIKQSDILQKQIEYVIILQCSPLPFLHNFSKLPPRHKSLSRGHHTSDCKPWICFTAWRAVWGRSCDAADTRQKTNHNGVFFELLS